jgi:predicted DNA-binding transcriptional regulator YafY
MRADRLLSILLMLQNRGKLTARVLAEELEVSERTIYRDLDALSTAGVPVYCERGPGGGCALLDSYRTDLTGLTRDEVRALFMLNIPAALQQLGVDQDLRAALLKISAALPEILRPEGSRAQARIHLDSSPWIQPEQATPHLATLQHALWADRCLELTYRLAFGAQVQHLVAPYGLVAKLNLWHLVFSREESIFVLPVSDILDARLTERTFNMPPGFNLVEFWQQWSSQYERNQPQYPVLVRLSPQSFAMLQYFEDPILSGQRVPPEQDENGWYRLDLKFDTFDNARRWLLNFGGGVEILAPQALRASVQDFARQTLAVYQGETNG